MRTFQLEKMPIPLRYFVPLIILIFGLLLGGLAFRSEIRLADRRLAEMLTRHIEFVGHHTSVICAHLLAQGDRDGLRKAVGELNTAPHLKIALVLDASHRILAASQARLVDRSLDDTPLKGLRSRLTSPILATVEISAERDSILGIFPFSRPGTALSASPNYGFVLVQFDLVFPHLMAKQAVLSGFFKFVAAQCALSLLLWFFFHFLINKRMARLVEATRQMTEGRLDSRADLRGTDELGQLAGAFDQMAASIHRRTHELREANERMKQEIAERERFEHAAKDTERLYRQAIAAAEAVPYERDYRSETFTFVGEGIQELTGYSPAEMTPQLWTSLTRESFMSGAVANLSEDEALKRARSGDLTRWRNDSRIVARNGESRWIADSSVEICGADGKPIGSVGILQDITERKRAEERRLALERQILDTQRLESLGVLAGGIAHDFNNLLTAILGNNTLAALEHRKGADIGLYFRNIEAVTTQAAELCKQMLAYSGRGHFVVSNVDISRVLEDMKPLLEVSVGKKTSLNFDLATELPAIRADTAQLRQVILNLVINASEAIGDVPGAVHIRTGVEDLTGRVEAEHLTRTGSPGNKCVVLAVRDNGSGMTPETRARIFDPFFSTKFTGRGLGLAAVLGIVRGHGGTIAVQSQPGEGSTFQVYFPCGTDVPDTITEPLPTAAQWRGHGTVLIVDDEEDVRFVTAEMLKNLGFDVIEAVDGLEGLDTFRQHQNRITAVLLDMTMPRMNGEETFRELRRLRPEIQVLLLSGYSEHEVGKRFAGLGLAGFLQKPFRQAELAQQMRLILQRDSTQEPARAV